MPELEAGRSSYISELDRSRKVLAARLRYAQDEENSAGSKTLPEHGGLRKGIAATRSASNRFVDTNTPKSLWSIHYAGSNRQDKLSRKLPGKLKSVATGIGPLEVCQGRRGAGLIIPELGP